MECGRAKFHPARQQEQLTRTMGSTTIVGWGRGLWQWSEVMPKGVPTVGNPPNSPEVTRKTMERPMGELEVAGEEGKEGPKPLDEADINEAAQQIKDNPTLCLALGLTDSYWASMARAVGVRKLNKYEAYKNNRRRSQVISYSKLAVRFSINKDQLQEVLVMGKLWQKPKKCKAGQDERVVELKH